MTFNLSNISFIYCAADTFSWELEPQRCLLDPAQPPSTNFVSRYFRWSASAVWNPIGSSQTIGTFRRNLKTQCICFPRYLISVHQIHFIYEAFLRRSTAHGFRPPTAPTIWHYICSEPDEKLFAAITFNASHLLHHLLPPMQVRHALLVAYDITLSIQTTSLRDNNFINRMLYWHIGCIWQYCSLICICHFNSTTNICIRDLTVTCLKLLLTYLLTYLWHMAR